jgi:hypothetical protein
LELASYYTRSLGEKPIQSWTSNDGTFGVVPSLEASSQVTLFGLGLCRSMGYAALAGVGGSVAWHVERVLASSHRGDHTLQ